MKDGYVNEMSVANEGRICICHLQMVMVLFNGMKELLVPIDQAGRIVLPKNVREELAIQPGDVLKVSVCGTAVTLTPDHAKAGLVRTGKALVFSAAGSGTLSQESVNAIRQAGLDERHARIENGLPGRKRR